MKRALMLVVLGAVSMMSARAQAQAVPNLQKGNYSYTGVISAATPGCALQPGAISFGFVVYPGPGAAGFEIASPFYQAPATMNVVKGPVVPAGGLNAWTVAAPGNGTVTTFVNGAGAAGKDAIAISLVGIGTTQAQGSIVLSNPACTQTIAASLVRTG